MSAKRIVSTACAVIIFAACSIGKPVQPATTYVVDPPMTAAESHSARRPETLRMGNVRVAAAYAGNALVYRLDDVQYVSDPYHAFIAEPGAMLGNRISEWLDRAGPFQSVAQPGSARPAVQFALIDLAGARPKLVHERTIASRVELPQASPDALVRGYGRALAEILSQLVPELSAENVK